MSAIIPLSRAEVQRMIDAASFSDRIVIVNSAADLPAAVAGVRTLEDFTEYVFTSQVNLGSDELVVPNGVRCNFRATGFGGGITGTGSPSVLIESGGVLILIGAGLFNSSTGNRDVVEVEGGGVFASLGGFAARTGLGTGAGLFLHPGANAILMNGQYSGGHHGIEYATGDHSVGTTVAASNCSLGGLQSCVYVPAAAVGLEEQEFIGVQFRSAGGGPNKAILVDDEAASLAADAFNLIGCKFSVPLDGLDPANGKFWAVGCAGAIRNSGVRGGMTLTAGAAGTVFGAPATWTKAAVNAATALATPPLERLSFTGGSGTLEVGDLPGGQVKLRVRAIVKLTTGGASKDFALGIARDGVVVAGQETVASSDAAGNAFSVPVFGEFEGVQNGAVFDLWVRNDTDTTVFAVRELVFIVEGEQ